MIYKEYLEAMPNLFGAEDELIASALQRLQNLTKQSFGKDEEFIKAFDTLFKACDRHIINTEKPLESLALFIMAVVVPLTMSLDMVHRMISAKSLELAGNYIEENEDSFHRVLHGIVSQEENHIGYLNIIASILEFSDVPLFNQESSRFFGSLLSIETHHANGEN